MPPLAGPAAPRGGATGLWVCDGGGGVGGERAGECGPWQWQDLTGSSSYWWPHISRLGQRVWGKHGLGRGGLEEPEADPDHSLLGLSRKKLHVVRLQHSSQCRPTGPAARVRKHRNSWRAAEGCPLQDTPEQRMAAGGAMAKATLRGVVSQKGSSGALGLPAGSSNVALLPRALEARVGHSPENRGDWATKERRKAEFNRASSNQLDEYYLPSALMLFQETWNQRVNYWDNTQSS